MMMNREAREELYDVKRGSIEDRINRGHWKCDKCGGTNIIPHKGLGLKCNSCRHTEDIDELESRFSKFRWLAAAYDPAPKHKRKRSAWLSFVIAHKSMRTAKGLLDLKAISKLWKLKQKVLDPAPKKHRSFRTEDEYYRAKDRDERRTIGRKRGRTIPALKRHKKGTSYY